MKKIIILSSLLIITIVSCEKSDTLSCWECVQTYYKVDTKTVIGTDKQDICDKTKSEIKQMESAGHNENLPGYGVTTITISCSKK